MKDKSGIHLDSLVSPKLNAEDCRKAQIAVASNSLGVEDCRQLLDMLGLNFDVDTIEFL